jgi:hypothetical protein
MLAPAVVDVAVGEQAATTRIDRVDPRQRDDFRDGGITVSLLRFFI